MTHSETKGRHWWLCFQPGGEMPKVARSDLEAGSFCFEKGSEMIRVREVLPNENQDGWISVKERLPEVGKSVAMLNVERFMSFEPYGNHKKVGVLWHNPGTGFYWSTQGSTSGLCLDAFTHWILLPEDPKESK